MTPKHLVRSTPRAGRGPEGSAARVSARPEPSPASAAESARALDAVIDETRALFHRLRAVAADVHGGDALTGGRRGVLRDLLRRGPLTVPQMARSRPVSRQHIQTLVNGLLEEGLVKLVENPAHRRSRLVRLTPAGAETIRSMTRREAELLGALGGEFDSAGLADAARVLRLVRERFEGPAWRNLVATGSDSSSHRND